jgi:hypothetical protein
MTEGYWIPLGFNRASSVEKQATKMTPVPKPGQVFLGTSTGVCFPAPCDTMTLPLTSTRPALQLSKYGGCSLPPREGQIKILLQFRRQSSDAVEIVAGRDSQEQTGFS